MSPLFLVRSLLAIAATALVLPLAARAAEKPTYDLVVYGGTSAGVAAAVQAKRLGRSVALIESTHRLGGLTTGGLGQTDIGNKSAIGGISREFYGRVREHYSDPAAWNWQTREAYRDGGQTKTDANEDAMWTFEPSVALEIMNDLVREHDVPVFYGQRLDRSGDGVTKEGARIVAVRMESGETYRGSYFIDATYEGDLLAEAGVSYAVGREPTDQYGESYNGVQPQGPGSNNHNFVQGVDPYVVKGDPSSGLLPYIDPNGPGEPGAGDERIQAYCFRMCLTDHPENRIPFAKPDGYDERNFELLLRNYEAGYERVPWINSSMPNRKTDTNNRDGFSTDFIGQNYDYPEASYEERATIVERHRAHQQGLMWTLANHPRVPEKIRKEVSRWGTCKDEFEREDGWQEQLYVREARRMIGPVVMTQQHCLHREVVEDSVGLAAYGMDSHHMQRYVTAEGHVRNEGNIETGVAGPYPIGYQAITPKRDECENLLVPVCVSASHIAFGSIRMEPVFMVLGQSAATAASLALDEKIPVQDVEYAALRTQLLKDAQRLERPAKTTK
ncbi:MAG TPA: FAD-dependent oxidoreductase [Pirellulaceae bacterium]|jgi:hypothetical protein|nr:FAD-dependent oxidoreductase [Pirellulaceae bacterium]